MPVQRRLCWRLGAVWALLARSVLAAGSPQASAPQVSSLQTPAPPATAAQAKGVETRWLDRSVDPCVDFYAYACGNWLAENPMPPDQSRWSAYAKLQDETRFALKTLLEQASQGGPGRSPDEQKIGDYYAACMDEAAIEHAGAAPLAPALAAIDALSSTRELAGWVAHALPRSPEAGLFVYEASQDFKAATEQIATLDQGGLGLPDRDFYLKSDPRSNELRAAYSAYIQNSLQLAGLPPQRAVAGARAVLRLETALARGSQTRVDRRNPGRLYHPMTPRDLQRLSPNFDWQLFFRESGTVDLPRVNVVAPRFFQVLSEQVTRQSLETWKLYLMWHAVAPAAENLSTAFVDAAFDFYGRRLEGRQELPARWKRCTEQVDANLGEALGHVYVERFFSAAAREQAQRLVRGVQAAMAREIQTLPWMSAATKTRALEKLHTMMDKVGYPSHWRDYSSLEVRPGDAFGNAERAATFEYRRILDKIGKPVDRSEWAMTASTVNAYYDPQLNDMNFPAAVLQPPLFDVKAESAANYGNTGATIGHELTHGFDDEGRRFDARGNLSDWWLPEDSREFERRVSCVSRQYSKYTIVDQIKINGKLTAGEDVADLGGLLLAYLAWKQDHPSDAPIDGLSAEQRFFIAYGQSWCTHERDETARLRATVDPHSPERYRTNGVVSNLPQFQAAFQCKAGSPMVRAQRCSVW
jgi:putative endopeptidase